MDLNQLPAIVWDNRVNAYRAPAFRYLQLRAELQRRGIVFSDEVRPSGPVPGTWDEIELRPYQHAALTAWELSGRQGIIVLPTGSGKTRVALAAMARTFRPAICLVPTRVMLEQWTRQIRRFYRGEVGCYGDGNHRFASITVATFESAYRHLATLGNRFDLLIIDEVHHLGQSQRDEALEMSVAAARLGLTATPSKPSTANQQNNERIGPLVYELRINDLSEQFLARFDVISLSLDLTPEERRDYETEIAVFRPLMATFRRAHPLAGWADFIRAAYRTEEGRRAIAAWRKARDLLAFTKAKSAALHSLLKHHREVRVLIFTADNTTAYTISREHLIMPITCDIGRDERAEALTRFKQGELGALVSARVLNEGLDVPDAEVAIIVGGSQGEREYIQRIGRLLRPRPGKLALVYELVTRGTWEVQQAKRRRCGLAA